MMVDHVFVLRIFFKKIFGVFFVLSFDSNVYSGGTLWECGKVRVGYMESGRVLCGSLILLITSG
jgi:hypothetical protein